MNRKRKQSGFTIIEIIIAIMVLTVGLLALVTTAALVTRMIARGQRSAVASMYAAQRAERMGPQACVPPQRPDGRDTLYTRPDRGAPNAGAVVQQGQRCYRLAALPPSKPIQD